jgi:hypothetical protein
MLAAAAPCFDPRHMHNVLGSAAQHKDCRNICSYHQATSIPGRNKSVLATHPWFALEAGIRKMLHKTHGQASHNHTRLHAAALKANSNYSRHRSTHDAAPHVLLAPFPPAPNKLLLWLPHTPRAT